MYRTPFYSHLQRSWLEHSNACAEIPELPEIIWNYTELLEITRNWKFLGRPLSMGYMLQSNQLPEASLVVSSEFMKSVL